MNNENIEVANAIKERRVYIDTEPYHLPILQYWANNQTYNKSSKFFQESENWAFNPSVQYNDNRIEQHGIIGMLIIDSTIEPLSKTRKIIKRKFVQLVGEYATKENFSKEIAGITYVLCYHGRLKPDRRGYITSKNINIINIY